MPVDSELVRAFQEQRGRHPRKGDLFLYGGDQVWTFQTSGWEFLSGTTEDRPPEEGPSLTFQLAEGIFLRTSLLRVIEVVLLAFYDLKERRKELSEFLLRLFREASAKPGAALSGAPPAQGLIHLLGGRDDLSFRALNFPEVIEQVAEGSELVFLETDTGGVFFRPRLFSVIHTVPDLGEDDDDSPRGPDDHPKIGVPPGDEP
jgi:hypothetical protein